MSDASSSDRDAVNSGNRPDQSGDEDDIHVVDILIALAKHKKILVGLPAIAIGLAIIYSLLLPNIYTASAKILPLQQGHSSAAALLAQLTNATPPNTSAQISPLQQSPSSVPMLAQLGNAAALMAAIGGHRHISNELVIGVLKSRTVTDNLVQRFGLIKVYDVSSLSRARTRFENDTKIFVGKDGMITISIEHQDPKLAAELANGYVDELMKLSHLLVVTEASQRRQFFEQQLMQAKSNLAKVKAAVRQKLEQGGEVNVDEQERVRAETTARLRAQISTKEMQIGVLPMFAGKDHPNLRLAQDELNSIKRELVKTEEAGSRSSTAGIGDKGLDHIGLLRDLKYNETLYQLLSKQYQMAKIDEAKDSPIIQVLDEAIVPQQKSKPTRSLIVLLWASIALFAAMIWVFTRESMSMAINDPQHAARWSTLRRYLGWR